jgi:hypothetical protein
MVVRNLETENRISGARTISETPTYVILLTSVRSLASSSSVNNRQPLLSLAETSENIPSLTHLRNVFLLVPAS